MLYFKNRSRTLWFLIITFGLIKGYQYHSLIMLQYEHDHVKEKYALYSKHYQDVLSHYQRACIQTCDDIKANRSFHPLKLNQCTSLSKALS